ncbi:hypothetical protein ACJ41O_007127 [Fusarium nematophilum]
MRLDMTLLVAALASTCTADSMTVYSKCGPTSCIHREALFFTSVGTYSVNASDGCRKTKVPGMTDFCVDWKRNRAHFKFSHQSSKRCLIMRSKDPYGCSSYDHCYKAEWKEVSCNWRLAAPEEDEPVATVSADPSATEAEFEMETEV